MRLVPGDNTPRRDQPVAASRGVARSRHVLITITLGATLMVGACGGRAAAPADIAAATTPVANTASDGAGVIPTVDFMARMPTFAAIPTQDIGPSPVELVRKFDVASPNLSGMALDRDGNIYVGSRFEGTVLKYGPEGELLTTWRPATTGDQINVLTVDEQGDVHVHAGDNYIQKFDSDGKFLLKWGGTGTGEGQFNGVSGMAIDRHGNYYVVDRENQRVQKFDRNREFLLMWDGTGAADGRFSTPMGILVDARGDVYVSDPIQLTVQKFDSNGRFLLE